MKRPERDYSHRSLFDKLGVNADSHVALVGTHDEAFVSELDVRLAKAPSRALRTSYDLIFVRVDDEADLARIGRAASHLRPAGGLWTIHPKGRGARPSSGEVRAAGLAAGLVDNKVSAYDPTHSALRFVIPLATRP
jgi:hypothetical protein